MNYEFNLAENIFWHTLITNDFDFESFNSLLQVSILIIAIYHDQPTCLINQPTIEHEHKYVENFRHAIKRVEFRSIGNHFASHFVKRENESLGTDGARTFRHNF